LGKKNLGGKESSDRTNKKKRRSLKSGRGKCIARGKIYKKRTETISQLGRTVRGMAKRSFDLSVSEPKVNYML